MTGKQKQNSDGFRYFIILKGSSFILQNNLLFDFIDIRSNSGDCDG